MASHAGFTYLCRVAVRLTGNNKSIEDKVVVLVSRLRACRKSVSVGEHGNA